MATEYLPRLWGSPWTEGLLTTQHLPQWFLKFWIVYGPEKCPKQKYWHKVAKFILLRTVHKRDKTNNCHLLLASFHKRKDIFPCLKGENKREALQQSTFIFKRNARLWGCCASWGTYAWCGCPDEGGLQGLKLLTLPAKAWAQHGLRPLEWKGTFLLDTKSLLACQTVCWRGCICQKGQPFLICTKHFWGWQWLCFNQHLARSRCSINMYSLDVAGLTEVPSRAVPGLLADSGGQAVLGCAATRSMFHVLPPSTVPKWTSAERKITAASPALFS